jgi:putative heme-binding domain-containing protein
VLVAAGPTFVAKRAPEEARKEFLASSDEWFRPVNLANSPDGSLTLVDMYRATIEHPQYMPKGLAETLDLRHGDDRGRLYRITGKAQVPSIREWPGNMNTSRLVRLLEHTDSWWRETAQRLIVEQRDLVAVPLLRELARTAQDPVATIHALWTLEGIDSVRDEDLVVAANDARPIVREHAVRLMEPRVAASAELCDRLTALAADSDSRVRFWSALVLGQLDSTSTRSEPQGTDRRVKPLARIVERDYADPWTQVAVLSSSAGIAAELWSNISNEFKSEGSPAKSALVARLGSIVGARHDSRELELFMTSVTAKVEANTWWQLAAMNGLASGLRASGNSLTGVLLGNTIRPMAARVQQLIADSKQIALDKNCSIPERVAATQLSSNLPASELLPVVSQLLSVTQPQEVQLAAVHAADSLSDPGALPMLLDQWASHSPAVRREVIEAAFRRRERVGQLLDAIEAGKLKAADLDLNRHQQLLNHNAKEIKGRAAQLFESEGTPNRKEVIESYRSVLATAGDPERGRSVFTKHCATCHQVQGAGHRVGPELTGLRSRNREALLMDILDPNRALEPNYANYLVATRDGRVLSGIIAAESATSITLRRAEGVEQVLLRQDLEQVSASGQSLMPEGLERNFSQAEMADLIEFLRSNP